MFSRVINSYGLGKLLVLATVFCAPFFWVTTSYAQNEDQTQASSVLEDNYEVAGHLIEVIEAFDANAEKLTAGTGGYYNRVMALMILLSAIRVVILLIQYVFAKLNFYDLLANLMQILLVAALLFTYTPTVDALSDYAFGISSIIQAEAFGNGDVSAPIQYMVNQIASFEFESKGLFGAVVSTLWEVLTTIVVTLFLFMTLIALYLPVSLIFMLKIIGLLFIPTLLLPQISFLFVGWARTFMSGIVYIILARISIIIVVVLFSTFFNEPIGFGPNLVVKVVQKSLPVGNAALVGILFAVFALGAYLLFLSGQVAAKITGGIDGGLSAAAGAAFSVANLSRGIRGAIAKGGK